MATFVNPLRLTELATGEGSGTWGTTTNTNLELIGEALGYGTQDCFASDADATTTIADGAVDPARALYFKVTSSATLTATRTLTIAPNTINRVMWVENATTGSQSITISQGSGTTVTVGAGKVKAIYLDGSGTGANVAEVLDGAQLPNLQLGTDATVSAILDEDDMSSDSDTALATQQSIKAYVDSAVGSPTTDLTPAVDDSLDLGSASKRWQDLYLSGGIYIGGTSSANFIDDYEEGTFTLSFVSGPSGVSSGGFSSSVGTYVKNGNMVMGTVRCTFVNGNAEFNSATDFMIIQGTPFWPTTQQMTSVCTFTGGNIGLVGLSALELRPDVNLPGYLLPKCPFAYGNGASNFGPYSGFATNFYFYINQ